MRTSLHRPEYRSTPEGATNTTPGSRHTTEGTCHAPWGGFYPHACHRRAPAIVRRQPLLHLATRFPDALTVQPSDHAGRRARAVSSASACTRAVPVTEARRGTFVARLPQSDVSARRCEPGCHSLSSKPTGHQYPSSPQLVVEHPIVRVDTNDRVQYKPRVLCDVGPEVLAEMVYRGMATGQPWGRGRHAQGPVGSPIGHAQPPAGRPVLFVLLRPQRFVRSRRARQQRATGCGTARTVLSLLPPVSRPTGGWGARYR